MLHGYVYAGDSVYDYTVLSLPKQTHFHLSSVREQHFFMGSFVSENIVTYKLTQNVKK